MQKKRLRYVRFLTHRIIQDGGKVISFDSQEVRVGFHMPVNQPMVRKPDDFTKAGAEAEFIGLFEQSTKGHAVLMPPKQAGSGEVAAFSEQTPALKTTIESGLVLKHVENGE
jgi:hypothetical protein